MLIESGFGDAGLFDQFIDANQFVTALEEERGGGIKNALFRCRHLRARYRQVCLEQQKSSIKFNPEPPESGTICQGLRLGLLHALRLEREAGSPMGLQKSKFLWLC